MTAHGAYAAAVSDLLLTKLLPEMEHAEAKSEERGTAVPAEDPGLSLPESIGALKARVSSYNALLNDALDEVAVQREGRDPRHRSLDAQPAADPPRNHPNTEQSMRAVKKQRV